MYLKQIEIIGFKSFADKSKLVLAPGVTGVVGPNGSGKSNIADAIRWVLGEQSVRNLRGSKMEDVIFAGSETRKPTNLCEVSLVLDNEDRHLQVVFDEVTITRRVFRSGESEYFINRQPCRLKDIHELFMDTGLGRDAYSIIGQGKIEEMLSTRAEDRRGPFEDAAGIVKFKHRRREAERKLEETKANLVRVEDILAELEEQVGPLEREKERAERYREFADALQKAEIALLVVEIDKLNERFQQATRSVADRQAARDLAQVSVAAAEAKWQQQRQALDELTQQVEQLQQHYVAVVEQRQKQQGDLALIEQELGYLEETERTRLTQQAQHAEELKTLDASIEQLRASHQAAEGKLHVLSGELEVAAEGSKESRRVEISNEIDNLNAEYIEANHRAATLRNELKMLEEQLQSDAGKRAKYEQDAARWTEQIEQANRAIAEVQASMQQLTQQLEQAADEIRTCDAAYEEATAAEANAVAELQQVRASIQTLSARHDLLRDLEEGYDGYALGVRTVMQQASRNRLSGIHGTVAELVRVPKDVELAVETALGGALQNIVVATEADARAAIQMLKQRQAGRATFMPIDVIQSRRLRDAEIQRVREQAGFVGIASDLVDTDAAFRQVVEHLLGNVVVADTLEHANALARVLQYRVRIVTYQGDVVAPGGVMSGGHHQRKGPGLLGRSRERTDLEDKLAQLRAQEEALRAQQAKLRLTVTEAQSRRTEAQRVLEQHATQQQGLEVTLRDHEHAKRSAEERLAALEWEFHQLASGKEAIAQRHEEAARSLAETDALLVTIAQAMTAQREALAEFEKQQQVMQERLTGLRIEVATLRQERDTLRVRLDEALERKARLQELMASAETESRAFAERKAKLLAQAQTASEQVTTLVDEVSTRQSHLDDARQARLQLEAEVRQLEQAVSKERQAFGQAEELLHRVQVAAERADADLAHALQKMGDSFGMTYEWAKERYPLTTTPEELEREVQRLRRSLQALGDVNLGAIEEYQRLAERIGFLTQQRDDLVSAQEKLDELIEEIDTEMANRFLETFYQIQEEFAKSFEVLFGGGEARLELTQPDDPLTTGIDVIAKPPGKRLQNLNLLSGGERALTAMALLFAILRVRPVPFCVLDEVEAALDEANVARFAQQLRMFAGETQFIVITHRRGTMEEADALYGVTMPERGVSSLVSVRLTDDLDFETA
ncbi:chromosome segregation protein SMC [Alicyclobacillus suci]|uniref:chromosome segregation protein SMC n=1 Tax=Alicyclobacillus suci TaxID=2816080 RepID=UPI001A8E6FED|nr:chromosome segregation protein SMC [Alicyclobacillus suci]